MSLADLFILLQFRPICKIPASLGVIKEDGSTVVADLKQQVNTTVNAFDPPHPLGQATMTANAGGATHPSFVSAPSLSHGRSVEGSEDHADGEHNPPGDTADVPLRFRRPPLLPKNLQPALCHLDEYEHVRLLTAATAERW